MTGSLPEGTMTSQRLYDALDLCLECKGCKAECPSGVDLAKLKYEFLGQYYKANRMPLRSKVFAHVNRLNRLGSRFAPFSNWGARTPLGKFIASAILGVHSRRQLPPFARQTLPQWFNARPAPDSNRLTKGTVALFDDTFMNYNYPQIGQAAVELLEAAGFRVTLANAKCCGRPMLSKGLLDEAAAHARYNGDLLHAYADQGILIVGCEPSCLLTLKDEYPELAKGEKARKVAEHSYLIDDFLMMLQDKGGLELEFRDLPKRVLFHGHCHQKALVGTANAMRALRLPPGYQVEQVNSGCCGMAGSFGFEKEHYEIFMKVGGEVLFPAIEAKGADWEVAVTGVSCRQQIGHATWWRCCATLCLNTIGGLCTKSPG